MMGQTASDALLPVTAGMVIADAMRGASEAFGESVRRFGEAAVLFGQAAERVRRTVPAESMPGEDEDADTEDAE